jgi:hypothetical protein
MKKSFGVLSLGLLLVLGVFSLNAETPASSDAASAVPGHARLATPEIPLWFEANHGQTEAQVQFLARGPRQTIFLTPQAVILSLHPADKPARALRLSFAGTDATPRILGRNPLLGKVNYFMGNDRAQWRTGIPTFARVVYQGVYPGVDAVFYGRGRQLEYDLVVQPGTDPSRIALAFDGADRMELDSNGALLLHVAGEVVRQSRPIIYQEIAGIRREVSGGYTLRDGGQVGFQLGAYDPAHPLVIDPVLLYSTYLGGSSNEIAWSVAVDAAGNAYVSGYSDSLNFPVTPGAAQTASAGGRDIFVAKLNPTGSGLVYATYIGGTGTEEGRGIAVDSSGNAHISGPTDSSDFPVTVGALQTVFGGVEDCFVVKLDSSGSSMLYATYLGGTGEEVFGGIAVDNTGVAHVAGSTRSLNFPVTPGVFQPSLVGFRDIFVAKLNSAGSALVYSTYIGGGNFDDALGIAVDSAGQAYVAGRVFFNFSPVPYPTTPGAFQTTYDAIQDGLVTKLSADGSALVYSTLLGGSAVDEPFGIALDSSGNAYLTGRTFSADFPTTAGSLQTTLIGSVDAFVTKLNPTGTGLVYSTLLGGSEGGGFEIGDGIAVDSAGNAYVVGTTPATDFPVVAAFQPVKAGGVHEDAFIAKLNAAGTALVYSSYIGSFFGDAGNGIAIDSLPNPNAYIVGQTTFTDFPVTTGVVQPTLGGASDGFVAKIGDIVIPPATGKVTGGGTINIPGGTANFGFIVQRDHPADPITGEFQYVDKVTGGKLHSVAYSSFSVVGNTSTFSGTCTLNGAACTFSVTVVDNGEPGKTDEFTLSINAGPAAGGTLRSGNVKIH